jgi:iron complex outermembrane receptor protein
VEVAYSVTSLASTPAPSPPDFTASSASETPSAALQEVTVTAQRRAEDLQQVPIVVSAFSAQQLAAAGVTETGELDLVTPGLTTGQVAGFVQPHLRGVGTLATNPGIENPVALYVDGVYYSTVAGASLELNNISKIEVDKGPQGTLFGRNSTGGVIQVTTLDPTQNFSGNVSTTVGNYQTIGASMYVTGGLTPSLAADFAGYLSDQGQGFGRNIATGNEVNKTEDVALRSKWLLDLSDATRIKLALDYEESHFSPVLIPAPGTTPLGGPPYTGPAWGMNSYYDPYGRLKTGGASLEITHDFSIGRFSSLTAYRRLDNRVIFDSLVPTFDYALNIDITEPHYQWSQEFQLASHDNERTQWVTGIYLFTSDARYSPLSTYGGLLAPLTYVNVTSTQKAYSAAAYGQMTQQLAANTRVTVGLRYTFERREFDGSEELGVPDSPPIPAGTDSQSEHFERPTWRLAFDHRFGDDHTGYISYSRGFKSGGFNDDEIPTTKFEPEQLDDYEIGLKNEFADKRLRLNVGAFYYDYKNLQVVRFPSGVEEVYNAPSARIYGIDLDAQVLVTQSLRLRGGLEGLHTSFTSFPNAYQSTPAPGGGTIYTPFSAEGKRLPFAPALTADLSAEYTLDTRIGPLSSNVTYAYNSGWYGEPDNRLKQGSYSLLNAELSWHSIKDLWRVRLWGKNLTNTIYAASIASQANGDYVQNAPPRTYGITVQLNF